METITSVISAALLCLCISNSLDSKHVMKRSIDLDDVAFHADDIYLPRTIAPTFYKLSKNIDPESGIFSGIVTITVTCIEDTNAITLHVHEGLIISHRKVAVKKLSSTGNESELNDEQHNVNELPIVGVKKKFLREWYTITLSENLQKEEEYKIIIPYSGNINDATQDGLFRMSYFDKDTGLTKWYAATDMKSTKARWVFPCFDEPSFKVPFEISISSHEKYNVICSVMESYSEIVVDKDNWVMHHFERSPPLSTFSIGFALVEFDRKQFDKVNPSNVLSIWGQKDVLNHIEYLGERILNFTGYIEEYTDIDLPSQKLNVILLPHYKPHHSAHMWGILLQSKDELNDDIQVFEGVAAQFLYHDMTPYWWSNAPLFAYFIRHIAVKYEDEMTDNAIMDTDHYDIYFKYGDPEIRNWNVDVNRGSWIFHVLDYILSTKVLRTAFQSLIKDHQMTTISNQAILNFIKATSEESGKIDDDYNDIFEFYTSWKSSGRYPLINVIRDYDNMSATVEQNIFLRDTTKDELYLSNTLFYIPIIYITEDNWNVSVEWMRNEKCIQLYDLPESDKYIIIDPDHVGTYIVNYDNHNWKLLSNHLLDSAESKSNVFPARTRAKLLHDAFALAYTGEFNYAFVFNLTLFLKYDTDIAVWNTYFNTIEQLQSRIEGTSASRMLEKYNLALLKSLLRNLLEDGGSETVNKSKLKTIASSKVFDLSGEEYDDKYGKVVSRWMDIDASYIEMLHSDDGSLSICQALKWGSSVERHFIMDKFNSSLNKLTNKTEIYHLLLSCAKHKNDFKRLLILVLLDNNDVNYKDVLMNALNQISHSYEGYSALFDIVKENLYELKRRYEHTSKIWNKIFTIILQFKTQEGYDMVTELYEENRGEFGTAEELVRESRLRIKKLAHWNNINLPVINDWLTHHLTN